MGLNDLETGSCVVIGIIFLADASNLGLTFQVHIRPNGAHSLLNHELSLSIGFTAPDVALGLQPDSAISWPFSFFANGVPILPEEAEEMFRVSIQMCGCRDYFQLQSDYSVHQLFPELSAMCGFDPALDGADICDYFGWYPWEKFDEPSDGDRGKHSHNAALFSQLMHGQGSRTMDRSISSGIVESFRSNVDNGSCYNKFNYTSMC